MSPANGPPPKSVQGGAIELWKAADVAAYLRVHPKDVYELTALRGLPCLRIGRRLRFDPGDVLRWVEARKER